MALGSLALAWHGMADPAKLNRALLISLVSDSRSVREIPRWVRLL